MRTRLLLVSLVVVLSLIVSACAQGAQAPSGAKEAPAKAAGEQLAAKPKLPASIDIGTASPGGTLYVMGSLIAEALESELGIRATASPTEGSVENIRLLDQKKVHLGVSGSIQVYQSYNGVGGFDKKYTTLRTLAHLTPNSTIWVTLEGSGIKAFRDLKAKRVGSGPGAATWTPNNIPFFAAHDMKFPDDVKPVWGTYEDMYSQLKDGALDAAVGAVSSGRLPIPAIKELMTARKIYIVPFDPQAMDKMVKDNPYMAKLSIPKDALGLQADFPAVNNSAFFLLTRDDLDDETAYQVVKSVHKQLAALAKKSPNFQYALDRPQQLTIDIQVPYHPGAIKYWKEAGLWQQ